MSARTTIGKWHVELAALLLCAWTAPLAAQQEDLYVLGSASCGNSTCHGNLPERGPRWRSSQAVWEAEDPHATAGLVLLKPESQRMVEALDRDATTWPRQLAVLKSRCFGCHTTFSAADAGSTRLLAGSSQRPPDVVVEGVSCESCHGPASRWIKQHVLTSWSGSKRFDANTGMRNTESWLPRIQTCVRCHVGSRTSDGIVRDVNHDLIAAGHPALRFDALLYNINLPKHWEAGPESERPLSHISQTVLHASGRWQTLAAAAALARDRMESRHVDLSIPYPEFADYDCFGCHHELKLDSDRRRAGRAGRPDWNPWYTAGLNDKLSGRKQFLLSAAGGASAEADQLIGLEKLAQSARDQAAAAMRQQPATPVQSLRSAINRGQGASDWHDAAAWYLGLRAALADCRASQTLPQRTTQEMAELADTLVSVTLRFGKPTGAMQSPRYFDPDAIEQTRNELTKLLLQAKPQ